MNGRKHGMASSSAILVGTALAAAAVAAVGCAPPEETTGRTVTDLAGREVAVPGEVKRLIALGPGALRLVVYLGATDRVVGIEDFEKRMARDLYVRPYAHALGEDVLSLPVVGAGGPGTLPDPEKILTCRPDLLVCVGIDPGQLDTLQAKTGVPAMYLSYGELGVWREEAQRSLALLGKVLGREERAASLNAAVASLERDLRARTHDIPTNEKPTVYIGGISFKGTHGLTSTEAGYPPARMAGARNLADGLRRTGHFFVDKEQILVWNPDVLFVDLGSRTILDQDVQDHRGFYRLLKAVKAGRVFSLLPYNYYNTNMELALLNAYFIGKSLYPERFDDVRMKDKARDIMETFLAVTPEGEIPACRAVRIPETGPVEWR